MRKRRSLAYFILVYMKASNQQYHNIIILSLSTCGARHSDVDVDVLFVVQFRRHSECCFTVTTVVTEEKPASVYTIQALTLVLTVTSLFHCQCLYGHQTAQLFSFWFSINLLVWFAQ